MKYLLDTHLVLWVPILDHRLSSTARGLIEDPNNDFLFSVASIWEISIKRGLARGDFRFDPRAIRRELLENGYVELPIVSSHAFGIEALPHIHKDPFDRILIAQATVEGITLLTADAVIAQYPGPIQKV